jgi:hypothetical protein
MLQVGNTILGWANYTQGKPRVIVRSLPNEGYLWRYLGETNLHDGPKLDPFFNLPAWKIVETTSNQSTEEIQAAIIDTQASEIISLTEANTKLLAEAKSTFVASGVAVMAITNIGNVLIEHEPEWGGAATIRWGDGVDEQVTLPGHVLFELLTTSTNLESASVNLLSEVILLRKDYEILRRQASLYRIQLTDTVTNLQSRLEALENA